MSDSENLANEDSSVAGSAPTEVLATHATPRYEADVPVSEAAADVPVDAPHRQSHLMPEPKAAAPLPTPEVTHQPQTEATPAPMVQAAPVIATDAPASTEALVQTPAAASAQVAVAAPEPVPAMRPMPAPATQASTADIDSLLSAAGLTMAVTNPEKLRAVQAASEQVTPVARAPRERKPSPPMSNEPLVQVETQR